MSATGGNGRQGRVRIAVLFGGQSGEHDVSLRSAQTVMGALDPARYEVVPVGITREGRWLTGGDPLAQLTAASPLFALAGDAPEPAAFTRSAATGPGALPAGLSADIDVVFPALHGPLGEDGAVQGLLELAGLPYVGSGVLGSAVAMDKAIAKTILAQAGLPQARWRLVPRKEWERAPDEIAAGIGETIGFPCFVKPANMGSSVGVGKATDLATLAAAMNAAARHDRRIVVEEGVDARELELSVLGNDEPIASVAGEIVPCNDFYDYAAKYIDEGSRLIVPAAVDGSTMTQLQELAIDAFRALDLAGMARVDFFLDRRADRLLINEVNTIPGFTSISMYPKLWEASGVPLPELVDRLIQLALERHGDTRRA
ncbi:MAG: D-alanine--D-alanine ligase [Thermomicrobiales bacterium]|nr:D-alanine--D-alanine ligase [Thermomicrobiales bacterium]